jgi:hypothetical protein
MTIREAIDQAGGILIVALKLRYSVHSVTAWYYGRRTPMKAGSVRAKLAKMAGTEAEQIDWQRKAG